jgi:hypothetical protein
MSLRRNFWTPEPLEPIRLLADLRSFVLERSHTRLPRWHFRVASDLVLRVQPRPGERRDRCFAFAGTAFFGDGITRARCDKPDSTLVTLPFGITAEWSWQPLSFRHPRPTATGIKTAAEWRRDYEVTANTYRERTLTVLRSDCFAELRAEMMLSPACLYCGKALTDPVSVARWVGPECAGTSRLGQRVLDLRGEDAR